MKSQEENKRAELLECALRLFVAHGYDGVGVQQIVSAAGVTKPTLYYHFGNKLSLLDSLLDENLREFFITLEHTAVLRHNLTRRLTNVAQVTFRFARSNRDFYWVYLSLWFAPLHSEASKVTSKYHERHYAILEKLFRDAVLERESLKGYHRAYAVTFLACSTSMSGWASTTTWPSTTAWHNYRCTSSSTALFHK